MSFTDDHHPHRAATDPLPTHQRAADQPAPADHHDQLLQFDAIGRRIAGELRALLAAIPPAHSTATELSRWTAIDRAICHRVLAAGKVAGDRDAGAAIFADLPGAAGLQAVLDALAHRLADPAARSSAAVIAREYALAIALAGGSQSKLLRRIDDLTRAADEACGEPESSLRPRRCAFDGVSDFLRLHSQANVAVQIVRPDAEPGMIDCLLAIGYHQLRRRAGHLPIQCAWDNVRGVEPARGLSGNRPAGVNPGILLSDFSSRPFPTVVTRNDGPGSTLADVLDFDPAQPEHDLDVFVALRARERRSDRGFEFHIVPRIPTRALVLELHLHRDLALDAPPAGSAHFIGMAGMARSDAGARWFDRTAAHGRAFDLSAPDHNHPTGFDPAARSPYPRLDELAAYLHRHNGWTTSPDPDHAAITRAYRVIRSIVPFPLWGCDYALRIPSVSLP